MHTVVGAVAYAVVAHVIIRYVCCESYVMSTFLFARVSICSAVKCRCM